jgi:hypothetical protein
VLLVCLATGTAYSEPQANKPYKVCPEVVTAKDTPCKVATPTAAIVHRTEIPKDDKDRERVKMVIDMLREMANALEKDLEKPVR